MKKESLATKDDVRRLGVEVREEIAGVRRGMATKKELTALRSEMATKKDLAKLRQEMVTHTEMELAINWAIQKSEERTDERARKYRDEILTAVSGVMGELKVMREEHTALSARVYENHEGRIIKLEEVVYSASKTAPAVS